MRFDTSSHHIDDKENTSMISSYRPSIKVTVWSWAESRPPINTLRPRQNGCHFADDMFKCIFLNENVWIPIEISLKFVPKGSINNNLALFQIMAWRRPGDKPLSEPMMVSSPTHICVTRPQWVNYLYSWLISLTTFINIIHHYVENWSCGELFKPNAKRTVWLYLIENSFVEKSPVTDEINR